MAMVLAAIPIVSVCFLYVFIKDVYMQVLVELMDLHCIVVGELDLFLLIGN